MTRHTARAMAAILVAFFLTSVSEVSASFKWSEVELKGKGYVTLQNIKDFYGFTKMTRGTKITLENQKRRIEFKSGSKECRMNNVLYIMSDAVISYNGRYLLSKTDLHKLIDPILRPWNIGNAGAFNTVVIDPGHGGSDSGAKGYFANEEFYALNVAKILRDKLQARGYKVVMTRDRDVFVSRQNRVKIANKYPRAIFISLHFNSASSRSAHGVETFTVSPVGVPHMGRGVRARDYSQVPGNIMDAASIALATAVHSRAYLALNGANGGKNFGMKDRGIKRARFDVLQGIKIPAILYEGGFLSNRTEAGKIHSSEFQQSLATGIFNAINVYQNSVK